VLIYTCKNKSCKKYLLNEIALCKIICDGVEGSLDPDQGVYLSNKNTPLNGRARCFHCGNLAFKKEMVSPEYEKNKLLEELDKLDSEIEDVMKSMGCS
jgi:hypothetical protein